MCERELERRRVREGMCVHAYRVDTRDLRIELKVRIASLRKIVAIQRDLNFDRILRPTNRRRRDAICVGIIMNSRKHLVWHEGMCVPPADVMSAADAVARCKNREVAV